MLRISGVATDPAAWARLGNSALTSACSDSAASVTLGADAKDPGRVVAHDPAQGRHARQADQRRRRVEEVLQVGQDVGAAGDQPRTRPTLQRLDHALDRVGALDLELREAQHQAIFLCSSVDGLCGASSPACSRRWRSWIAASTRAGVNGRRSRRTPTAS